MIHPPIPLVRVLVAEDEPAVREVVRRMLEDAGCRVTVASNGEEALRIFERDPGKFDLLVTDFVMPILNQKTDYERVELVYYEVSTSRSEDVFGNQTSSGSRRLLYKVRFSRELADKINWMSISDENLYVWLKSAVERPVKKK